VNDPELEHLLRRLEHALTETSAGLRDGTGMVGAMFFLLGGVYGFVQWSWGVASLCGGAGILMVMLGNRATKKTAPEQMRPVYEAVRDAPERVVSVRHYQTSDSRHIFVSDWLEIRTADHRLVIKAKDDWEQLYKVLQRRCPAAQYQR
jgi:hypothetical protein